MSRIYEYDGGNLTREGYFGEGKCPICGAFIPAIYYDDGTVKLEECYYCKEKKDQKQAVKEKKYDLPNYQKPQQD